MDQYARLKSAPVSSAVPVAEPAPAPAGRRVNRSAATGYGAGKRSFRSSRAGRNQPRKKLSVMTLAGSATASGATIFRLRIRSRYRRLWPLRFSCPAPVARYRCCARHRDHARAASRHLGLQYRWQEFRGGNRCSHPFSRHFRCRGRRDRRCGRPPCSLPSPVGLSEGPMGGHDSQKLLPRRGRLLLPGVQQTSGLAKDQLYRNWDPDTAALRCHQ
jgi:hypothetical protein